MIVLPGLQNGETYYVAVRAQDQIGNEDTNSVQMAVTPVAPTCVSVDSMDGMFFRLAVDTTWSIAAPIRPATARRPGRRRLDEYLDGDDEDFWFIRWQLAGDVNVSSFNTCSTSISITTRRRGF
jgi:hypothetical protein